MSNANLNLITTANTFNDWMILTDNEANSINELRNGNYYKDGGNFTVANGTILVTTPSGTTLSVTANALVSGYLTAGNLSLTQNLSVTGGANLANLNVSSTVNTVNLIATTITSASETLSANLTVSGGTNVANLNVASTTNTSNLIANTLTIIDDATISGNLIMGGVNVNTVAIIASSTANAAAKTVAVLANGSLIQAESNINFNNTSTVQVSAVANGTSKVDVGFTVLASGLPGDYEVDVYANGTSVGSNSNINFNNSASVLVTASANGSTQVNVAFAVNSSINLTTLNVSSSAYVSSANLFQPMIEASQYLMNNVGSINSPNTVTFNVSLFESFDVTTANTGTGSINVTFASWRTTGNLQTVTIIVRQPGSVANTAQVSSNLVNWTNTAIKWNNGETPVLAGFVGKCDIITLTTVDGGATIYGAHSMANCG